MNIKDKISKLSASNNIAEDLDDQQLKEIADECLEGLEVDEQSMEDWLRDADDAMDLVESKRDEKDWPFEGAANVKYPLSSLAVLQFSSRTLPELVKNGEVVKYRVVGSDLDGTKQKRGDRIKNFLNYQILEQIPNWMDEHDKLISQLAVVGTCFTKSYWDPRVNQIRSEVMRYDLIKVNNDIKCLEDAPRITQYLYLTKREIIEHMRWEMYRDLELDKLKETDDPNDKDWYEFVEQHCWLNLLNDDENEIPQPYIVTIHKKSRQVMRIVARFEQEDVQYNSKGKIKSIDPCNYFADYHFISSPRNQFFCIGFGTLLLDINEMSNSMLNQILNCGTLSMTQGGVYSKDCGLRNDDFNVEPGEWIAADNPSGNDISKSFMPFNYAPPSPVTFQTLEMLINAGKELTSSTEALTGMQDTTNVSPNAIYAVIQQGLKVFIAIQRRYMRGNKKELAIIMKLNSKYVDWEDYLSVIDINPNEVPEMFDKSGKFIEFLGSNIDIVPVTDLAVSSEAETLARVNAGMQLYLQGAQIGATNGVINPRVLYYDAFKALNYTNLDQLIIPEPQQKGPDPAMIKLQADLDMNAKNLEFKARELDLKARQVYIEEQKASTEGLKSKTQSIKNLADAEAVDNKLQIDSYKVLLDDIARQREINQGDKKLEIDSVKNEVSLPKKKRDLSHLPNKNLVMQSLQARGFM